MRFNSGMVIFCMVMSLSAFACAQAPATPASNSGSAPSIAATRVPAEGQSTPPTAQLVQASTQPKSALLEWATAWAPVLAFLGIFITAYFALRQGRMDARYTYAAEILKFRLRQVEEFYAPAFLHIGQSQTVYEKLIWTIEHENKTISRDGFRLLDYIHQFREDPSLKPLIERILAIGKQLTTLISEKSGLIEGGVTPTFVEYQAHFEILNAAREQRLTDEQKEGWHKLGYYPRMLNREILEGYKTVLKHLENYTNAGDEIISRLLKQKAVSSGKLRRQLIENLRFYEGRAKEYSAKFDSFNLSGLRQTFLDKVESTRDVRPRSAENKLLDAGCGTGRDTYEFLKLGFTVTAIDASPAMLREAKRKLREAMKPENPEIMKQAASGSHALEMTFDEMQFRNEFDGVWAAASLLHVSSQEMEEILRKLMAALKPNGILFMSFKYGAGEHEYDARFYSYYGWRKIKALLRSIPDAAQIGVWLSDAEGKNLSTERQRWAWALELIGRYERSWWLNVLVQRKRV